MRILQASFRTFAVGNEYRTPATMVGLCPNTPIAGDNVGGTCIEYIYHVDMINPQHSTQMVGLFPLPLMEISATAQWSERMSTKPFLYQERPKVKIQMVCMKCVSLLYQYKVKQSIPLLNHL